MRDFLMDRTAFLSDCGTYRDQAPGRRWGGVPAVVWVMPNPSTADHVEDVATTRKCIGFTSSLGY